MNETSFIYTLITALLIAGAGGIIGSFALLRRMALVGDALSHVALPGIAMGIIFHFNVFIGSFVFLLIGTVMIWAVEHKTKLPVDTLVGIFFAISLAVGALFIPEQEIFEALFGDITKMSNIDYWIASISSVIIISLLFKIRKKLTLTMISEDLSFSVGFKPHFIELLFLLIFALTVAVGIKFTGALLMGSLIIIPAAIARNVSGGMKEYLFFSAFFGVFLALISMWLWLLYDFPPGPVFIIISGLSFFFSIFFRK